MPHHPQHVADCSPEISDEIRHTTCYMCACRCGINVHLKKGKIAYIEGNRNHPVNRGVLCAKGSAGIMQAKAPARLKTPLKRVGPRGSGEFEPISWDEALGLATKWLGDVRARSPQRCAFFTGRDQSQSLTSYWAQAYGTPNYAAHGGFCSVNMAAAGIYTMGGSFWEFGQPDWDHTRMLVLFGVAEDHDSNPIKIGIGKLKARGAKLIGVNPVRTGYNAVADDWFSITPGSDGLFVLALVHCLLQSGRIALDYLMRYTNAPCLVDCTPGTASSGLLLRDRDGTLLVIDRKTGALCPAGFGSSGHTAIKPDLAGRYKADGREYKTVFLLLAERYLADEYSPEAVAKRCGINAKRIRKLAADLAHTAFDNPVILDQPWTDCNGTQHQSMRGNPVSFHAMRGISAHSNGFQTCRALHLLQILLGTVETPGGMRFKPPYPKPASAHPRPHCRTNPGEPLDGPHLGFVHGPDDLCLKEDGSPARIDKGFSWENPLSIHGLMHMVIANAVNADPYELDVLFLYMANMAWNSAMNTKGMIEMLTRKRADGEYVIGKLIYSDAYASEMVAYADLILPDTTYLERHDCISLLDRPISEAGHAGDAIRWPVIKPDRDVRGFQSVLLELGARLGLSGFVKDDGSQRWRDYADYITGHERRPGIGPLMGFRGSKGNQTGRGAPNPDQLERYIEHGGFYTAEIPGKAAYFKPWNRHYQEWAVSMGFFDQPQPYRFELYSEPLRRFQLAAEGHGERQPPDYLRDQIRASHDPLPIWYPPLVDQDQRKLDQDFPLHALTQRPMAMYHSWGTPNAWLRQIHGWNPLYIPGKVWREHGFQDGDWARLISRDGEITIPVARMEALNENTVWTWNAIGKRKGSWALSPSAPEACKGFLLNHLIHELLPERDDGRRWANADPITGQAAWFDLRVRIEKCMPCDHSQPIFAKLQSPVAQGPEIIACQSDEQAARPEHGAASRQS
ncbi:MAG: molybdopterin oxidoreductase family protein [Pseudomonadota bacterium]